MMAEPTATDPLGQRDDPHPTEVLYNKLREAYQTTSALDNSREKSLILTKLDEARHWLHDLCQKLETE